MKSKVISRAISFQDGRTCRIRIVKLLLPETIVHPIIIGNSQIDAGLLKDLSIVHP